MYYFIFQFFLSQKYIYAMSKIIYYYQTFNTLKPIIDDPSLVTHIHLSAIHFGNNPDNTPYIHLNDNPPDDAIFDTMWQELECVNKNGTEIVLMIGGAGGAFTNLFADFETYYNLLKTTIRNHPIITGVDLDVEEDTDINNIRMLINKIDADFGADFIIAMAPVAFSLINDERGFGGFIYKDLYNSPEGRRISYFNGQFYGCFNTDSYNAAVSNGYPPDKVNLGMISSDFSPDTFGNALDIVKSLKTKYPNFGGVFVWEYLDAPPGGNNHPELWATGMHNVLYSSESVREVGKYECNQTIFAKIYRNIFG